MSLVIVVVVTVIANYAQGWWCNGHMSVAQVAKSQMSATTLALVEEKLKVLSTEGPFPQSPDFVQTGCWADDLKDMHLKPMESWHFDNLPYSPDGTPPVPGVQQEENVASVIMQLDSAMKDQSHDYILAFSLANLIHFYGDSHQPLHVINLFSKEFPRGDRGGNEEKVEVEGSRTTLHFVWDAVCWKFPMSYDRPLNATSYQKLIAYATYLLDTYKFSDADVNTYNSSVFVEEGYALAVKYAYVMNGSIVPNGAQITPAYLSKCLPVAEGRLTLAGLRLGRQLEYLLKGAQGEDSRVVAHRVAHHVHAQRMQARNYVRSRLRDKESRHKSRA